MVQDDGVLKFDHEEIEDFINELNYIISDLEEDIEEAERAKEQVQTSASGYSVDKYDDYRAEISNYRSSIEFYEAIVSDLEEFLREVDDQVKFTRNTKFEYDDQMITEISNLIAETKRIEIKLFNKYC